MSKAPINLNDKPDKEAQLGTLIVVLLKARNLNDKHSFRKQDVFAQATLNGAQKRTNVDIKGGQHPEWDGEVRFYIMKNPAAKYRKLEVACYAQEPRSEDLLGKGVVDITETLRTGEFDDWVSLEVDGVQRGELYLEMTYYANAPAPTTAAAPNKFLSAVQTQNSGLQRRPSKLSPADRLSRPQVGRPHAQPSLAYDQAPSSKYSSPLTNSRLNENYTPQSPGSGPVATSNALPASLKPNYPSGSSPKGRQDPLPSNEPYHSYPNSRQSSLGLHQPQVSLPTTLRPGPAGGSPPSTSAGPSPIPIQRQNEFGHVRHPSSSPPAGGSYFSNVNRYETSPQGSPNPYFGGSVSPPNPPNPYIGGNNTLAVGTGLGPGRAYSPAPPSVSNPVGPSPVQSPYTGYGSPPNGPPIIWRQDAVGEAPLPNNGSFSFPMPAVSPTHQRQSSYPYNDFSAVYNSRGSSPAPSNTSHMQNRPPMAAAPSSDDPYLHARYQTPLPLPPGASSPLKALASAPVPTGIPTPPQKMSTPGPDLARFEALKRAEDDARRRREQELRDLELAMALDRELNLAEERASSNGRPAPTAMPGGW
ncbi:hypothetical protein GALMADRAFT_244752 [Galerina marginata CBS 339.88]|uniref:C2 domain-containing protein n=1 Tax=Galerina marginata (strain CBS 339.88) TaxID=685588 RepID=A0A067TJ93_GALM3|nr:hypothetical protein GALMADRAFT_244752 [Galerina marginata CBS 339.88]